LNSETLLRKAMKLAAGFSSLGLEQIEMLEDDGGTHRSARTKPNGNG
jgi:hypothetical protein